MAKRTRRRTRSRNRRRQSGFDSQSSNLSQFAEHGGSYLHGHAGNFLPSRSDSANHWQTQWDAWQTRKHEPFSGSQHVAEPLLNGKQRRLEQQYHRYYQHRQAQSSTSSDASSWSAASRVWGTDSKRHSSPAPPSSAGTPVQHFGRGRPPAEVSVVEHRLRMFGGEVDDGLALCEPMMKVVRGLFDGKLDYLDP